MSDQTYTDDNEEPAGESFRLLKARYLIYAVSIPDDEPVPDFDEWLAMTCRTGESDE